MLHGGLLGKRCNVSVTLHTPARIEKSNLHSFCDADFAQKFNFLSTREDKDGGSRSFDIACKTPDNAAAAQPVA